MARLIGAQRMVLQAILDVPTDPAGYISDAQIAQKTQIAAVDVRDWIETLEGDGYVQVARTQAGLAVSITAQGKLLLKQYRPFPEQRKVESVPAAEQHADPRLPILSDFVIDSTGNLVMLYGRFYEARSVNHVGNTIKVIITSQSSEDDSDLRSLRQPTWGGNHSIAFGHGDDALVVNVETVDSEEFNDRTDWVVTLRPEHIEYGGHADSDGTTLGGNYYSPDEIAKLRASRILLNDPPPTNYDSQRYGEDAFLEDQIRGSLLHRPVQGCILKDLYVNLRGNPALYLRRARLAAIFDLKAGDVIERVDRFVLGPIRNGKVHVDFVGSRRKHFDRDPHTIRIEGECPLA
jgi:hypothetical protein